MKKRFSWRSALVAAQVALAFAALAGGSLLLRSLTNARGQDLGFDADPLYLLRIAPGQQDYRKPRALELYRKIREEVIAIPGVEAAAWSENRLLRGAVLQRQIYVGPADEAVRMGDRDFHRTNIVGPTFLETVGLSLLRGRDFAPRDTEGGRKVAIVNSTMAQGLWHGEDPVGRSFHFGSLTGPELEVIGVVEDARYREMLEDPQYFVYLPLSQNYASAMTLHVRASGDPLEIAGPVNARVRWLAPELATTETQTMRRFVDEALWSERTSALFLTIFAILSSLMAALGIYATVAYTTARRAPEFGVRAALGASASQLAWPTFLEGARVITGGLFVGWLLAYLWIAPLLTTQLHEVGSLDPAVLAWLFLSFASVGLTSSWISSKRIANRDTAEVLRTDF